MAYKDHYLKFRSSGECADAFSGLAVAGIYVDEVGDLSTPGHAVDGWHVNIRALGDLPVELKPFCIPAPTNPKRVWA